MCDPVWVCLSLFSDFAPCCLRSTYIARLDLSKNYVFFYRLWSWHRLSLYHRNLGHYRLLCAVCQDGKYVQNAKISKNLLVIIFLVLCTECQDGKDLGSFRKTHQSNLTFPIMRGGRLKHLRKLRGGPVTKNPLCHCATLENSKLSVWFPAPCQHGLQLGELKSQWGGVMYNFQICLIAGFGLLSLAHMFDHMEKHRCF